MAQQKVVQKQKQPAAKQELVKPDVAEHSLVPLSAPEYLSGYQTERPEGFEEVRSTDVKVPRIALAQALTPQLNEEDAKYIPNLKKGQFFNTLTGKIYGESFRFIPLLKFGNRLRFEDMDKGGGILCRSNDMKQGTGDPGGDCFKCPCARFGSARGGEGKGTDCKEFYNFPVLVVEDGKVDTETMVAVFSMKSSHIEAAQHMIGLSMRRKLEGGARAPMWAGVYSATSRIKKFGGNLAAYVPVIDNDGWVPKEFAKMAQDSYKFMFELREQGRLTTDIESEEDETFATEEPGGSDESNR